MNRIKSAVLILAITFSFGLMVPASVQAASVISEQCVGNSDLPVCKGQNAKPGALATDIISTLLFVVGVLSVLMIIVGGIMYVISAGDSANVTRAKNTIIYAIVGLIVSLLAYVIVKFVIQKFTS